MKYIVPIILYLLLFTWHTKDYNQSWKTWKGGWWWMAGAVIIEAAICMV